MSSFLSSNNSLNVVTEDNDDDLDIDEFIDSYNKDDNNNNSNDYNSTVGCDTDYKDTKMFMLAILYIYKEE